MTKLATLSLILAALPATAHEARNLADAHAHPHGSEILVVAMASLFFIGFAVWKSKKRS